MSTDNSNKDLRMGPRSQKPVAGAGNHYEKCATCGWMAIMLLQTAEPRSMFQAPGDMSAQLYEMFSMCFYCGERRHFKVNADKSDFIVTVIKEPDIKR